MHCKCLIGFFTNFGTEITVLEHFGALVNFFPVYLSKAGYNAS